MRLVFSFSFLVQFDRNEKYTRCSPPARAPQNVETGLENKENMEKMKNINQMTQNTLFMIQNALFMTKKEHDQGHFKIRKSQAISGRLLPVQFLIL